MSARFQTIRSLLIAASCVVANWSVKTFVKSEGEITLRDRFGWWLEEQAMRVFAFAYNGSDEELQAVWNCEIPPSAMSPRQRNLLPRDLSYVGVSCCHCHWIGTLDEAADDLCPECNEGVWITSLLVDDPQPLLAAPSL